MLIKESTSKYLYGIKSMKTAVYLLPATSRLSGVKYIFQYCVYFSSPISVYF